MKRLCVEAKALCRAVAPELEREEAAVFERMTTP